MTFKIKAFASFCAVVIMAVSMRFLMQGDENEAGGKETSPPPSDSRAIDTMQPRGSPKDISGKSMDEKVQEFLAINRDPQLSRSERMEQIRRLLDSIPLGSRSEFTRLVADSRLKSTVDLLGSASRSDSRYVQKNDSGEQNGQSYREGQSPAKIVGDFSKLIGIDQSKEETLLGIVSSHRAEYQNINRLYGSGEISESDFIQRKLSIRESNELEVDALLGKKDGDFFRSYEASAAFQPIVSEFEARCADAGVAISPDTAAALRIILMRNLPNPNSASYNLVLDNGLTKSEHRRQVALDGASASLSEAQMQLLQQYISEEPYPGP